MTFEEFLDDSQVSYSTIETKDDLEDVIKKTWNAAINAALNTLYHDAYYYDNGNKWNDDCYSYTDPKSNIKKLLTA